MTRSDELTAEGYEAMAISALEEKKMTLQDRINRARINVENAEQIVCEATDKAIGAESCGFEEELAYLNDKISRWNHTLNIWTATLIALENE